jgi:hypothetical protein
MNELNQDYHRFVKSESSLLEVFDFLSAVKDKPELKINLEKQREKTLSIKGSDCSGPLILDTFQATFSNSAIF